MSVDKTELVRISIERLQAILRMIFGKPDVVLIIRPYGVRLEVSGDWPMVECGNKEIVKVLASNWEAWAKEKEGE